MPSLAQACIAPSAGSPLRPGIIERRDPGPLEVRIAIIRVPDGLSLESAAPLMCAGITMYSPLVQWGAGPGTRVANIGMGGLGHMGVKLAAALGAGVSVLSQTLKKDEDDQ